MTEDDRRVPRQDLLRGAGYTTVWSREELVALIVEVVERAQVRSNLITLRGCHLRVPPVEKTSCDPRVATAHMPTTVEGLAAGERGPDKRAEDAIAPVAQRDKPGETGTTSRCTCFRHWYGSMCTESVDPACPVHRTQPTNQDAATPLEPAVLYPAPQRVTATGALSEVPLECVNDVYYSWSERERAIRALVEARVGEALLHVRSQLLSSHTLDVRSDAVDLIQTMLDEANR